ncbi:aldolase [Phlegmacium glaucopus]|nr:aldolase [Phlegmacium glaucopus]
MSHINTDRTSHNLFSVPGRGNSESLSSSRQGSNQLFVNEYHSAVDAQELMATALALVNPRGKGIYASDESPDVMTAILNTVVADGSEKQVNEEENKARRRKWKAFAFNAISSGYVSGAILHAESLIDFKLAPMLSDKGIIPGVRANGELTPIPRSEQEFSVQGLDDLLPRMQAARAAGARFSKWRVPIACSSKDRGYPSELSLDIQADTLAQFAAVSQQAGLVPIVEPDVEFSRDADLRRSVEVHERTISLIYERMKAHGVLLEGSLIKPSFPQPGLKHSSRGNTIAKDIALATATMLLRSIPIAVPGVLFLSGGLPSSIATEYLSALNALVLSSDPQSALHRLPNMSFSFGRALQGEPIKHWVNGEETEAEKAFEKWSKACWHAARGEAL